jgi:hypothetical protein
MKPKDNATADQPSRRPIEAALPKDTVIEIV